MDLESMRVDIEIKTKEGKKKAKIEKVEKPAEQEKRRAREFARFLIEAYYARENYK